MLAWWDVDRHLQAPARVRGRPSAVDPPRRSAVRQRQHPHGPRPEQGPQGHGREVALHARLQRGVRARAGIATGCRSSTRWTRSSASTARRSTCASAMDPVEKRRRCREYALRFIDIQREEFRRLGVFGDWDNPYLTMAPGVPGGHRARVRALRGPRPRLQGPQARALVHALQDGARPGRGRVRGSAHAVDLREVSAASRAAGARPARSPGVRRSRSSGRPRRGRCRRTWRSRCIPTQELRRARGRRRGARGGAARWLEDFTGCSASAARAATPRSRRPCADRDLVGAAYRHPWIAREGQIAGGRLRRDGHGHRARAHRARPRRGGLRARPRARAHDLQPGRRRRAIHRGGRALRRA